MSFPPNKISVPLSRLIPSIITIMALCLGITSIRYSLDSKFNIAAGLISIAALLDGIDGRIARLLNSTTKFGAQLDSLADLCSFGVAPSIAVYLWSLKDIPLQGVGWGVVLIYIACSALRLARFNVENFIEHKKETDTHFFIGIPMPVGAGLLMLPLMCSFELLSEVQIVTLYWFIAFYTVIIGLLMISTIPVYSGKNISVPKDKVNIVLISLGIIFTGAIFETWIVLPAIGIVYIIITPIYSIVLYKKLTCKTV